jgi:alkylation response protein AidB-like acyl-CoA dehydrogenase
MEPGLTDAHDAARAEFRDFVDEHIAPFADAHDRAQRIPDSLIRLLGERGYLGAIVPESFGGKGMDALTWGLLCEEIGRGSASLLSLLTVHSMVASALVKWGTRHQCATWLPKLATGERIIAFGLTEPEIGSDAMNVQSEAVLDDGDYVISGRKRWISFGQVADAFLIFAQVDGRSTAFLVERDTAGFGTESLRDMLGFRSAMLADITMDACRVPAENMVGKVGFGFSHVGGTALDHGRLCIAWGAVGLLQGCVNACLDYATRREQFGKALNGHQLIQAMIAEMIVQTRAARLMCKSASLLKDRGDPSIIMEAAMAKYFSSRAAVGAALDAVQIHGANGCSESFPVARYLRDAKVLEIIEGSSQMQQMMISNYGTQEHVAQRWTSTTAVSRGSA